MNNTNQIHTGPGDNLKDKYVSNYVYGKSDYLGNLYAKFSSEEKNSLEFKAFIEELDYFNTTINNEPVIGLENKLISGNRETILWYAKEVKERYHKKLIRTSQFSESAQKVNVYLLAAVRSYFMLEIYPHVCNNNSQEFINTLIRDKIVTPLMSDLGDNLLEFTPEDIQGMLYFLTGNCHIKWTI